MAKIIFIGDIHIKFVNLLEVDKLQDEVLKHCETSQPSCFILAGDVLDTHERVQTQLLNRSYELIKAFRRVAPVYVLVGNHDYINNQQFLTTNHWMNAMKEWKDVFIVDSPRVLKIDSLMFVLVPYVPNGRLLEALSETVEPGPEGLSRVSWMRAACIFAHQEIKGCKMGAITSLSGDEWGADFPPLISGHIHERQTIGENVFYPGSALTHSYSTQSPGVSEFTFSSHGGRYTEYIIDLKLNKKKIVYKDVAQLDQDSVKNMTEHHKLAINGEMKDIASFKKTPLYEDLKKKGVKVVFNRVKPQTSETKNEPIETPGFITILTELIKKEGDPHLETDFKQIVVGEAS